MKHKFRIIVAMLLTALALLPALTMAQRQRETLTIQLDFKTPAGTPVTGTFVAHRTLGATVTADWTFNGLVQGRPVSASGTAVDRWHGDGKEEIEITSFTSWQMGVPQPPPMTISLAQVSDGVLTVQGLPLAVNGKLLPPGSGNQVFMATNAGQGSQPVTSLPNTAGSPHVTSLIVGGAVVSAAAILCLALGRLLQAQRRLGRNVPAAGS